MCVCGGGVTPDLALAAHFIVLSCIFRLLSGIIYRNQPHKNINYEVKNDLGGDDQKAKSEVFKII